MNFLAWFHFSLLNNKLYILYKNWYIINRVMFEHLDGSVVLFCQWRQKMFTLMLNHCSAKNWQRCYRNKLAERQTSVFAATKRGENESWFCLKKSFLKKFLFFVFFCHFTCSRFQSWMASTKIQPYQIKLEAILE